MADNPMLKFVGTGQSYPDKRSADERARDFQEIADRTRAPKRKNKHRAARNAVFLIVRSTARCTTISRIGSA